MFLPINVRHVPFMGMQMATGRRPKAHREGNLNIYDKVSTLSALQKEQKYDAVSEILERKRETFRLMLL
jgi:hypothetical protein